MCAGTPLLVDQTFLHAYSHMFTHKHVFIHKHDESQASAMLRVLHMSDHEHMTRRTALAELRQHLQSDARRKLRALIENTMSPASSKAP